MYPPELIQEGMTSKVRLQSSVDMQIANSMICHAQAKFAASCTGTRGVQVPGIALLRKQRPGTACLLAQCSQLCAAFVIVCKASTHIGYAHP